MKMKKQTKPKQAVPNKYGITINLLGDDTPCACCGKVTHGVYKDGMCDAHTHGMDKHGFAELQMVLHFRTDLIAYIINSIAEKIILGDLPEEDGAICTTILQNNVPVRLDKMKDEDGNDIFRIILPDADMKMPEESEEYPYNMQKEDPRTPSIIKNYRYIDMYPSFMMEAEVATGDQTEYVTMSVCFDKNTDSDPKSVVEVYKCPYDEVDFKHPDKYFAHGMFTSDVLDRMGDEWGVSGEKTFQLLHVTGTQYGPWTPWDR